MNRDIDHYAAQWEANARIDARFAVLTDPARRGGRWEEADFYASGAEEIDRLFAYMSEQGIAVECGDCLDFGCGAGRLTRPLAVRFRSTLGIDISPTMIELARRAVPAAEFLVNQREDLADVPDASVDFVHSNIVLQHVSNALQRRLFAEFCRVLRPGGLAAVQCPSARLPMVGERLSSHLPRVLTTTLRRILKGPPPPKPERDRLRMEMHCLPQAEVRGAVDAAGCAIEHAVCTNATESDYGGRLEFFDEPTALRRIFWRRARIPSPYLSMLYFIRKPVGWPQQPLDVKSRRP